MSPIRLRPCSDADLAIPAVPHAHRSPMGIVHEHETSADTDAGRESTRDDYHTITHDDAKKQYIH